MVGKAERPADHRQIPLEAALRLESAGRNLGLTDGLFAGVGRLSGDVKNRFAAHFVVPHLAHYLRHLVPASSPANLDDEVTGGEKVYKRT
jgi:hypothetical protein